MNDNEGLPEKMLGMTIVGVIVAVTIVTLIGVSRWLIN